MKWLLIFTLLACCIQASSQVSNLEKRYKEGISFYLIGEKQKAIDVFEKIHSEDSTETTALEFKSQLYGELNQYAKAAEGYVKLCDWFPQQDLYFSAACFYYTLINQPKLAETFGKKAVNLNSYRYNNMLNLAHSYLLQFKKDQSIYWYMRALQWVPSEKEFERAFIGDLKIIDSLTLMPSAIIQQYIRGLRSELAAININRKATQYLDSVVAYIGKEANAEEQEKILKWKSDFIDTELEANVKRTDVAANFGVDIGMHEYRKRNRGKAMGGYFDRAETIFKYTGDSLSLAQMLIRISKEMLIIQNIENKYGKNTDALNYAKSARDVVVQYQLSELHAASLHILAEAYFQMDDMENGRSCLLQLFKWSSNTQDHKGFFWATNGLSVYYSNENKPDSALFYYNKCISRIETAGLTQEERMKIQLNGLDLLYSSGKYQQVIQDGTLLASLWANKNESKYADLLELIGESYTSLNNTDSAYQYYKAAIAAHLRYSKQLETKNKTLPLQVSESRATSLRMLSNMAATKTNKAEFFHWMEMMKDNFLRHLISGHYEPEEVTTLESVSRNMPVDAAALMYVSTSQVQSPALAFTNTDSRIDWIDSKIVLQKIHTNGLQNTFSKLLQLTQKKGKTMYDSIGSARALALMQFYNLSNMYPAATRSTINKKSGAATIVSISAAEKKSLANMLYAIYVKPFESIIKGKKTLYISADLMQHFIPFETLVMDDGRYMAEVYDIIYTPGFTIHEYLANRTYNTGKNIVAAGNPDYGTYHPEKLQGRAFDFSLLGITSWTELPGTQKEIAMLQQSFDSVIVLSGGRLSETNLKRWSEEGKLSEAAVLHFSLHGIAGTTIAKEDNSLVITEPDNGNEDGLLQFDEALMLQIKPQLVCLSACETGLGMIERDGSLATMGTAFLAAGAKAVLVTNWSINDEATALFMKDVYSQVKDSQIGFAQAVANTKRKFITGDFGEQYKLPYFWAPFKYIGH